MSSAPSLADRRRAEIEAKRAKLAALKKQRLEKTREASRSDRLSSVLYPWISLTYSRHRTLRRFVIEVTSMR